MGVATEISWATSTFNPWWGCQRVSPGCENCYAEEWARRFGVGWGPQEPRRFFGDKHWNEPRKWNATAAKAGGPWRVFCASMADVFEDRRDLDEQRERLWKLIDDTPALTWMLLTKRPENIDHMIPARWRVGGQPGVWVGTTCEDQKRADARTYWLSRATWAAVRFLSCEPLVARVDLSIQLDVLRVTAGWVPQARHQPQPIDWVIAGGESGRGARHLDLDWIRLLRDQCAAAGVPFHFKQHGEFLDGVRLGKKRAGCILDGAEHKAFPEARP